jgi:ATP-binding cassette, subfamily B, multidrug efflux pump
VVQRFFDWLEGLCGAFPEELPEQPPTSFFGFVGHYSKPFTPLLIASATASTVVALLEVWLFSFVGSLVDWLSDGNPDTFVQEHLWELIGVGTLVLVIIPVLKFLYEAIHHQGLLGNYAMRTRWQAHRYLLRQSIEFYQNDFAGRVATKVMQTALAIRDTVLRATEVLMYVGVYFIGAVILFASSDSRLAIPLVVWLIGYVVAMYYYIPRLQRVSKLQADARSGVTGRIVDSYTNITTVKMFAHTAYEDDYAKEGMDHFLDTVHRQMRMVTWLTLVLNTLNAMLIFFVAATSIWLWQSAAITTGAIAFSLGLVLRMQAMSQWILWEVAGMFENVGVVQDGIETIARESAVVDAQNAVPLEVERGSISYQNIHFNYGQHRGDIGKGVIDALTLDIKAGEKVGIVGRSGAGKSTLVSLLLRFYDLESGAIKVDDQDIALATQESLRAQIGMVTQDTSLMHRSVFENIRYGRANSTLDEVIRAAKQAHAHDFILGLEDPEGRTGYQAHVGERGVKLSGGQRQRVAIARVLLKDAPILVLDEATSALDSEVEAAIQESFDSLMRGKTVIAIAHRLSTIAAMDRLIVMDQGEIVEQGSHQSLLEQNGLYASLWARQSGGFLVYDVAVNE